MYCKKFLGGFIAFVFENFSRPLRKYLFLQRRKSQFSTLYIAKNQKLCQNQNSKWRNFAMTFIPNLVSITDTVFPHIPYDSLSSYHIQIGIGSPKRHLFDRQFCVGLLQTFCKQWPKGPGEIPKF